MTGTRPAAGVRSSDADDTLIVEENVALFLSPQGAILLDVAAIPASPGVREVTTRQFRDNFFALLREVRETGCEVVVTNRGKPYVRVVREIERTGGIVGCDKDILRIVGDLPSPTAPTEEFYSEAAPMRVLDGETDWC